jgi:hypothetical protein
MPEFSPHELALLVWAYGRLQYSPGEAFLGEALAQLQERVLDVSPQSLANALWAVAVLGHQPGADFLQAAADGVGRQLDEFSHQSLGMALWGLASLLPGSGVALQESEVAALTAAAERLTVHYDARSLRMIRWALHRLAGQESEGGGEGEGRRMGAGAGVD